MHKINVEETGEAIKYGQSRETGNIEDKPQHKF